MTVILIIINNRGNEKENKESPQRKEQKILSQIFLKLNRKLTDLVTNIKPKNNQI